jgi:hypothetical protein
VQQRQAVLADGQSLALIRETINLRRRFGMQTVHLSSAPQDFFLDCRFLKFKVHS